jgi:hypothetical protein
MWKIVAKKMNRECFEEMSFKEKIQVLKTHGRYLIATSWHHYFILLYSLDQFFVELFYDTEEDELVRIAVAAPQDMEKHAVEISLNDLDSIPGLETFKNLRE